MGLCAIPTVSIDALPQPHHPLTTHPPSTTAAFPTSPRRDHRVAAQANLVLAGTVGEETGRLGANYFREFLLRRGIFVSRAMIAEIIWVAFFRG